MQSVSGEMEAGRKLKKKTAHVGAEEIGDVPEIENEFARASEALRMRNEFGDLNRINKAAASDLPEP